MTHGPAALTRMSSPTLTPAAVTMPPALPAELAAAFALAVVTFFSAFLDFFPMAPHERRLVRYASRASPASPVYATNVRV